MSKSSPERALDGQEPPETDARIAWTLVDEPADAGAERAEIARGLAGTPKRLPCRLFYDEQGSRLFERICALPEYYLTRTEHRLLEAGAGEIAAHTGPVSLVELGSGSATKTRLLIEAYRRPGHALSYAAIDVSASSLRDAALALTARYPDLSLHGVVGTYEAGLAALAAGDPDPTPRLILFLGSTIGNLDPAEMAAFLARLRASLRPGDWFLVGTDLRKDPAIIEAAYNDAAGVTAAFNLNILRHINRRFRADFALERFIHVAPYRHDLHRIEMHLESVAAQRMTLAGLGTEIALEKGERIATEISRKFDLDEVGAALAAHGFDAEARWTDERRWFGLTLARAV